MRCKVFGCPNSSYRARTKNKSVHLFRFPDLKIIRKKWLDFVNCSESDLSVSDRVCSDHFDSNLYYYETKGLHKNQWLLTKHAVPTIKNVQDVSVHPIKEEMVNKPSTSGMDSTSFHYKTVHPIKDEMVNKPSTSGMHSTSFHYKTVCIDE